MHHVPVTISRETARDLWRAYQKLAQGRLVIKALESITTGGVNDKGLAQARHRPRRRQDLSPHHARQRFGDDGDVALAPAQQDHDV